MYLAVSLLEMANTLPFKFYFLTNNGQDKEIRRIALKLDMVKDLTYLDLKEKVQVVYPQLLLENFNLFYIGKQHLFVFKLYSSLLSGIVFLFIMYFVNR